MSEPPRRRSQNGPRLQELYEDARRRHSRRSVLKAGAAGGAVLAAANLGIAKANAQAPDVFLKGDDLGQALTPFGRHLAFGADPTRQVVVSWQVPKNVQNPYLRIGTKAGEYGEAIRAETRALTSDLQWQEKGALFTVSPHLGKAVTQYYQHVQINDLVPDTTYYYVVGHQGFEPTEFSTFRTAPTTNQPFSFTAFGDQGVGYNALATNSLIADLGPQFHLAMGDLSYANDGEGGRIDDAFDARKWDSFFAQNELVAATTPWMVALGNHEMETWYGQNGYGGMKQRFTMPDNAWDGSTCIYSWRYLNVGLISLDGNDICYNSDANLDYTEGKQQVWLKTTLEKFRKDPKIDFIVVYCHQCTYSTSGNNGSEVGAQKRWAPLFDQYQVDLVLNGHNHVYERTDPIRGGKGTKKADIKSTVNPVKDGTTYITAGGGGESINSWQDAKAGDSYFGNVKDATATMRVDQEDGGEKLVKVTWSRVRYRGYGLVAVDVTPKTGSTPAQMRVRALTETGALIDELTIRRG